MFSYLMLLSVSFPFASLWSFSLPALAHCFFFFCLGSLDEEALREPSVASYKWLDPILCLDPAQLGHVCLFAAFNSTAEEWDCVCLRDPHEAAVHITGDTAWAAGLQRMDVAFGEGLSDVNPALGKCL